MTEDIYLDTQIWLDLHFKRGNNGKLAEKLITKIIKENKFIIYSDFTVKEFKKVGLFESEINQILGIAKPNIKRIHITKVQGCEALRISKQRNLPLGDVIHAVLARDNEAQLISRDPDFRKLKDIIKAKTPEELI